MIGVVLANLGTPDSPSLPDVRRYLREFLLDKRIVPMPHAVWRPILELNVLQFHARGSAAKYASVWLEEGSPLLVHARAQEAALQAALGDGYRVKTGMRYGQPSLAAALDELRGDGVGRVLVVPMYPQFSTTTVATVLDALGGYIQGSVDQFEYRATRAFHDHPGYIEAAAWRIEQTWEDEGRPDFAAGDKLLLSYHGIPASMAADGDPYPKECEQTTDLLRRRLGLTPDQCEQTYQSKFGKGAWLTPATIDRVAELGRAGLGRLDVFCPGFVADCLETCEEIGILNRETFAEAGGGRFVRVPCLNEAPLFIDALADLVARHTSGWE
ncbi:MAG: ferrochelatase [Propionibacteriaceae bacterium]|jgi:ferrochelatase|nr:ferrochelatase [Propionibacteriaceae bacterium]